MPCNPEALFHAHHVDLVRYLFRLSGDADLAADAAQEAFVTLLTSPPRSQHRAWLFRVGTNKLWDQLRTRRRRGLLLTANPGRIPTPSAPERPDERLERSATRRTVRAALEELSWRERTLLLMREEGFSHAEIAEAVGTTTASVGTMLVRALRKLCVAIEAHAPAEQTEWRGAPPRPTGSPARAGHPRPPSLAKPPAAPPKRPSDSRS